MATCKLCGFIRETVNVHDLGHVCAPCLRGELPPSRRASAKDIVDAAVAEAVRDLDRVLSPPASQLAAEVR